MAVWMLFVGAALIGLAAYDAVVTTVSTATAGGPLTTRIGRGWWRVAHRLARSPRSVLLSGAGPVILLTTVAVWLLLLWAGWTLVFSADPSAVVSSGSDRPADWSDRVYFAGFTIFTLGVGDYVPDGAPWQLLTVVATVSGLALTTAAITYLVPVVTAATQRAKQASTIAAMGGQAHRIVTTAYAGGSVRFLEQTLVPLANSLLLTAQRHLSYPILHYFHPRSAHADLRVQLAALDDALTLVADGVAADVERPHPAAVDAARTAIDHLLQRAAVRTTAPPPSLGLAPLRRAGIPTVDDDVFAARLADRREHRGRVAAYAAESRWQRPSSPD